VTSSVVAVIAIRQLSPAGATLAWDVFFIITLYRRLPHNNITTSARQYEIVTMIKLNVPITKGCEIT